MSQRPSRSANRLNAHASEPANDRSRKSRSDRARVTDHAVPPVSASRELVSAVVLAALRDGIGLREQLLADETQSARIAAAAERLVAVLHAGGTLLLCGNGGSAADCQHIAAELTGRFSKAPRRPLPAVALTTDSSALTAIANDFGYAQVFSRQVEALGRPGDALLCISTSGQSENVLAAAQEARRKSMVVVSLCGPHKGPLADLSDVCIHVPGHGPDRIQELHITVGHILCDVIDRAFITALPAPSPRP